MQGFAALSRPRHVSEPASRASEFVQFPLTFCVPPALLIVFLGPPLLSLID